MRDFMIEIFDWLSEPLGNIEKVIESIDDLEFLKILVEIDSDGQNRKSLDEKVENRIKKIKLEKFGFDLKLLNRLLNEVPFFVNDKEKETIPTEMDGPQ